jgi:UDP-galactopyranose mutase
MYSYLIIGSGLFGCVFAHEMKKAGKSCLVIEKRDHVGGNVYCEEKGRYPYSQVWSAYFPYI